MADENVVDEVMRKRPVRGDSRGKQACPRCGELHYNFDKCQCQPAPRMAAAEIVRQPRPGYRDWGHRLRTVSVVRGAVTSIRYPRRVATSGQIRLPDESVMDAPAFAKHKPLLVYPAQEAPDGDS